MVDRFGDVVITGGKSKCDLILEAAEFWGYSKTNVCQLITEVRQ